MRTGEAVPRAEKIGDLLTADHKVLNEGGESRNNHRYVVVVRDVPTQCTQSYPCKAKNSHKIERCLRKYFEPSENPKVIDTCNSLEFDKFCEELSWCQNDLSLAELETLRKSRNPTKVITCGLDKIVI